MILTKVSAVCRLRDGYNGRVILPAGIVCRLDGLIVRAVVKTEGYLVFTDLSAGAHTITVQAAGYLQEEMQFETGTAPAELEMVLKPGAGYPLSPGTARLYLTLTKKRTPAAGESLWLAAPAAAELKLAQTRAESGSTAFRIYCRGAVRLLPVPGAYLISDGKNSEITMIKSLGTEQAVLSSPLGKSHARGCLLLSAQCYCTDADGCVQAVFPTECEAELWLPERKVLKHITLSAGENRLGL